MKQMQIGGLEVFSASQKLKMGHATYVQDDTFSETFLRILRWGWGGEILHPGPVFVMSAVVAESSFPSH